MEWQETHELAVKSRGQRYTLNLVRRDGRSGYVARFHDDKRRIFKTLAWLVPLPAAKRIVDLHRREQAEKENR